MFPGKLDYQQALSNPIDNFEDGELRSAQPELDESGRPKLWSGGNAAVFRIRTARRELALRCFLKVDEHRALRFQALLAELSQTSATPCRRHLAPFEHLQKGIRIQGQWFPLMKMEWTHGDLLCAYIKKHACQPETIRLLANRWLEICEVFRTAGIAHGDIQPSNIVIQSGNFKLIDYDCMFAPGVKSGSAPSLDYDSPHYQHPQRTATTNGLHMDNFSNWIIYTSLAALGLDQRFLKFTDLDRNLLIFRQVDFANPSQSEVLHRLKTHQSEELQCLSLQIERMLALPPDKVPYLMPLSSIPALPGSTLDLHESSVARENTSVAGKPAGISIPRTHKDVLDLDDGTEEPVFTGSKFSASSLEDSLHSTKETGSSAVPESQAAGTAAISSAQPHQQATANGTGKHYLPWLFSAGAVVLLMAAGVACLSLKELPMLGTAVHQAAGNNALSPEAPTKNTPPDKAPGTWTLIASGRSLLKDKDYPSALEKFTQVILSDANNADALGGRAACYLEMRRYGEALDDFNKALALQPDNEVLYRGRGKAYLSLEQYLKAIADYKKAKPAQVDDPDLYCELGRCYGALGEYERAIEYFDQAIHTCQSSNAYYLRGGTYYTMGKFKQALADYRKAASLNPEDADAWYGIGSCYYYYKKFAEAREPYRKAVELYKAQGNAKWASKAKALLQEVTAGR